MISHLLNPKSSGCIHVGAVGYFFVLTFSVVYVCAFIAYPVIYVEDESSQAISIIFLSFVFINIMGNYFLGLKCKSFFKTGQSLFLTSSIYFSRMCK